MVPFPFTEAFVDSALWSDTWPIVKKLLVYAQQTFVLVPLNFQEKVLSLHLRILDMGMLKQRLELIF
jgi:hypothetical protein